EARSDFAQQNPDFEGDARIRNRFRNQSLIWDGRGWGEGRFRFGVGRARQSVVTRWGADYFVDESQQRSLAKLQYDQPIGLSHTLRFGGEVSRNELGL